MDNVNIKPDSPPPVALKIPPGFGRIHDGYQDFFKKQNGQDVLYAYQSILENTKARKSLKFEGFPSSPWKSINFSNVANGVS